MLNNQKTDYALRLKGRKADEEAFVLIKDNYYVGYGFIPKSENILHFEEMDTFLKPRKNTLETQRLIAAYLRKNPKSAIVMEKSPTVSMSI